MFHRFIRVFVLLTGLTIVATARLTAQPCADTQPQITGSQVVTNNQTGVIYSTPNIPGHTYLWTITGGVITSGAGTNQVNVTWGAVGNGTMSVQETNPLVPCSTTVSKTVSVQPLLISYFYYTNTSCYGDVVSFWDASVNDVAFPITNYAWTFGDGGNSTLQNPVHQYLPPYNITYTVTLIVTNSIGYKDTIYDAVYVNPNQFIPTAAFSSTVPNCLYDPVVFNSSASTTPAGTEPIIHYDWNFGDPASGASNIVSGASMSSPSHVFSAPGTYTVTLEITNNKYCKGSITHQVVILQSVPTAAYTFSSPVCLGNPVNFSSQSTSPSGHNITQYQWNFGDGSMPVTITPPASPNMSHTFPGLGPYTVQLRVTNDLGCNDSIRKSVSLDPSPLTAFDWDSRCFGDTIKFSNHTLLNNGPPIQSYWWDFGDPNSGFFNNSTLAEPSHIFTQTGPFNITLVALNTSGCPDTLVKQLIIYPPPPCDYTYQLVNPLSVQYHIDSSSTNAGAVGNMVLWDFGDGSYGYGWNPFHTYPTGGTYNVKLTVTDTIGCSNSVTHSVFLPMLPMAFFSSNSPVCDSLPVCFTDLSHASTPPFGYITMWIWDFGDGSPKDTIHFPNDPNVCHIYPIADTFAVTLKVFDNYNFSGTFTQNIIVLPNPVANFVYSPILCPDQVVTFTSTSYPNGGGNIVSYDWNFDDPGSGINNTSGLQNPIHTFTQGNKCYNVRLIVVNFNNCTDTMIKPVCIHPKPPVNFTYDTACLQQLVHFNADTNITKIDSITTWLWNFGDGTPTVTDPINTAHLYTAVDTYLVTLTITDIHGCTNFVQHFVEVNPLPVAAFTWLSPVCDSTPIQLTDQSYVSAIFNGYIVRWLWDFGDGTTQNINLPTSPNVSHQFTGTSLVHVIRLTVWTNDSCTAYIEHTVNSVPHPVANFDYSTVSCENQAVQFTDLSQTGGGGNISAWGWNFGEPTSGVNNFSTLQNPSHTYAASGTFTVTLVVTNVSNCHDTIRKDVIINGKPIADFLADTACLGNATHFTDLSVPNASAIVSYSWDFGDSSPLNVQPNPIHTYTNFGVYTVTLTIVNSNGCINYISKQVLVNPLPIAAYTWSTPNCQGFPACFTDMSTTPPGYLGFIIQWIWDFGDGTPPLTINFPTSPSPCHTFAGAALSHIVTLTVKTSDSCTASVQHPVTSVPSPIANFSYSTTNCAGQSVQFNDLSQLNGGGPLMSWNWNFGDQASGVNNTSTLQNPLHSYSLAGSYIVTLIIHNASNCSDTITDTISINQLPVAAFTADTACVGSLTSFTDMSQPNAFNIITYSWDFGDLTPVNHQTNPTHTYTNYGIYTVTLTITNSNQCIASASKQVLVNPLPIPAFTFTTPNCQGAVVHYTNLSTTVPGYIGTIVEWIWNFDDGQTQYVWIPSNPNVTHTFAGTSLNHNVTLTIKSATGADTCENSISHTVTSISSPVADFGFPSNTNCEQQPVQFTDLSQMNGGGPIILWNWNFGDPTSGNNTSTAQNPVHLFSSATSFTVTLIVTNSSGCMDTIGKSVVVAGKPTAAFTADTACLGNITTFTDGSTPPTGGTISQHFWEFGDGGTSIQTNPTYLYGNSGYFNVTLTVTTTNGCTNSTTNQVKVNPKPTAAFNSTAPVCAKDSVHFTDLSTTLGSAIHTWKWEFGDGQSKTVTYPTSQNVWHKYNNAGPFLVKLTVTTLDSCKDSKTQTITINPKPLANFDYAAIRCQDMPVQFTDISQAVGGIPIVAYAWNFGDPNSGLSNTSTQQDPTHNFTTGGNFSVNLLVTNADGCFDSITKPVHVNEAPIADFTADTACTNTPTHFTDASTAGSGTLSTWLWDFGDPSSGSGNNSSQQNPTHIYAAPGTYNVHLTVTNSNSCVNDTIIPISVNPKPQAMFSYTPACVGDSTVFTDLSIAPGSQVTTWDWTFGDGGTSTLQNPKHAYAGAGTYNVRLMVTNLAGCNDSVVMQVVTHPKPVAAYSYSSFFCPKGQVDFQDLSTGTGAVITQHYWIFEPGYTSTLPNPVHTFGVTDTTYLVTEIVTDNNGCTDTITDSVYVKPGFKFTYTFDTVCFGNPTHFHPIDLASGDSLYSPHWDFGDPNSGPGNTSLVFNATHIFTQAGTYVVRLKAYNTDNCVDSVFQYVIIRALPKPDYKWTCIPCDSLMQFADSSLAQNGTITTWIWSWGDGSPNDTLHAPGSNGDTTHIYATNGYYNVLLTVINSYGCHDTISHRVQRFPCIRAAYTYMDTLRCARYAISFADSSTPVARINQWHWFWGDGIDTVYTTFTGNLTHTYADSGRYSVKLKIDAMVNAVAFNDSMVQIVVIHPTPYAYFSNPGVCLNQITLFQDTTKTFGAGIRKYTWNFGDPGSAPNDTSSFRNPTHKYDTSGSYNVKLLVMNRYGCEDSITKQTRVYNLPVAKFANTNPCSGVPTVFTDMTTIADTTLWKWKWNFGDPSNKRDSSDLQNPAYKYKNVGDYLVRFIVKDHFGCLDTIDSTVTVHISPVSAFTITDKLNGMTGKIQLNNQSSGANSYLWDLGNGHSDTTENPVATYTMDGSYVIMLISSNEYNCTDTTYYKYEVLFKGLYVPNAFAPSSSNLAVRLFKPVGINLKQYNIQVYDNWGHLLWESNKLDTEGRPLEGWDGTFNGVLMPQATYMWKASATFIDDTIWQGSDIGKGTAKTMGTVSLIR